MQAPIFQWMTSISDMLKPMFSTLLGLTGRYTLILIILHENLVCLLILHPTPPIQDSCGPINGLSSKYIFDFCVHEKAVLLSKRWITLYDVDCIFANVGEKSGFHVVYLLGCINQSSLRWTPTSVPINRSSGHHSEYPNDPYDIVILTCLICRNALQCCLNYLLYVRWIGRISKPCVWVVWGFAWVYMIKYSYMGGSVVCLILGTIDLEGPSAQLDSCAPWIVLAAHFNSVQWSHCF